MAKRCDKTKRRSYSFYSTVQVTRFHAVKKMNDNLVLPVIFVFVFASIVTLTNFRWYSLNILANSIDVMGMMEK